MALPNDYVDRVYAGVLGKLIGVYLGRPFEGWTYERIMRELGPIEYYVHDRLGDPLVVTDDDVAGTFTFVRALEDYGASANISAEQIGRTWLNYIVKERSILWWGGAGNSTEHTAWLNLKRGIPAPDSGSIATNGQTVAEQIGAQIFIDGWALVAPNDPELAARLAQQAGQVSHDGESVHAAMLWAAMEASAFSETDIDKLIETGLSVIPQNCLISRLIADIQAWHAEFDDWRDTRKKIADFYGYDRYPGNCHVVPNHALMIMSILYAPDDFQRAQMIVNTSGWDTDCNAGNVGCLMGIKLGVAGIDNGPDWRGPMADRCLISSADGGYSINDAVRVAERLSTLGYRLAGETPPAPPKDGARFHFARPGSVQGFRAQLGFDYVDDIRVHNVARGDARTLAIDFSGLAPGRLAAAVTPTFTPPEVADMRTYELMATPLIYPGQTLRAAVGLENGSVGTCEVALRARVYGANDELVDIDGDFVAIAPGQEQELSWVLPDCGGQPIAEVGVVARAAGVHAHGRLALDWLTWDGMPELHLRRPDEPCDFWRRAWVNNVDFFSKRFPQSFRISQGNGQGMIAHGTRQWTDYSVTADLAVHLARHAGLAFRVQGLSRYYAARLTRANRLQIVRVWDDEETVLAETDCPLAFDHIYQVRLSVAGKQMTCRFDDVELTADDPDGAQLADGGIGLLVAEGALSSNDIRIGTSAA